MLVCVCGFFPHKIYLLSGNHHHVLPDVKYI